VQLKIHFLVAGRKIAERCLRQPDAYINREISSASWKRNDFLGNDIGVCLRNLGIPEMGCALTCCRLFISRQHQRHVHGRCFDVNASFNAGFRSEHEAFIPIKVVEQKDSGTSR